MGKKAAGLAKRGKGGFGRGGPAGLPAGKDKKQRYGKLISEPDKVENGQYIPWARSAAPGSVKEVKFNAEGRSSYLTGFRKRKNERKEFAKKAVSTKELTELKKGRAERKKAMLEKYEERVSEMQRIAKQAAHLEHMQETAYQTGVAIVDNGDTSDSDSDHSFRGHTHSAAAPTIMTFGNSRGGTAATVEVKEMDLTSFQDVAGSGSLPALPKVDHTKLSKKQRNPSRGRQRQLKKDKLTKSKRDKQKGRGKISK